MRGEEDLAFEGLVDGRFARFQAGERYVLLWWIAEPSRRVHSIRTCYRGLGFTIRTEPDCAGPFHNEREAGGPWSSFVAERGPERLRVYERIENADGATQSDVAAWYWSAILGRSRGPYWRCVLVERVDADPPG